jgi:peptidoglycan hydrolase CwlO-like protein
MKILLQESQESNEELEKKIKDANKMIDRLRDEIERFVLQLCLQNYFLVKKILLSNFSFFIWSLVNFSATNRLEENTTSKEAMLQIERQEHNATKKFLKVSQEKTEELMDKVKDDNKIFDRLQDQIKRFS